MLMQLTPHEERNNCHYFKWKLSDDISLLYFISFDTKKYMVGTYQIKSKEKKIYSEISSLMADQLKLLSTESVNEVIGRKINDGTYQKLILQNGILINITREK